MLVLHEFTGMDIVKNEGKCVELSAVYCIFVIFGTSCFKVNRANRHAVISD